ncbi:MAG: nucleotidyltransferase family protein [Nitrospinae bacterium]|nr:nucleotidyltransferase family protein [Nitrospinota bacterium]
MNLMQTDKKFDAVLVAGEGESSYKVYHQHKAFLKINNKCIINYVVDALQKVNSIRDIYIVGLRDKLNEIFKSSEADFEYSKPIHIIPQKNNLYENIWHTFLQTIPDGENMQDLENSAYADKAVLIVPCDSPLLTPHEVEHFISHSQIENHDHVLGLTSKQNLEFFYPRDGKPGIKMAYLHLKENSYRINNLHLVKPIRIENREYIQKMYQYRHQRNFKNMVLFGLSLLGKDKAKHYQYYFGVQMGLLFASLGLESMVRVFRSLTPKKALEKSISNILKARFMGLEVPYAGAALDIDNDRDYEAIKIRFNEWREYLSHPEKSPLPLSQ